MLLKSPDLVAERSAFGAAELYRRNWRNPNLPQFVTVSYYLGPCCSALPDDKQPSNRSLTSTASPSRWPDSATTPQGSREAGSCALVRFRRNQSSPGSLERSPKRSSHAGGEGVFQLRVVGDYGADEEAEDRKRSG
jgi:hypothetical protein